MKFKLEQKNKTKLENQKKGIEVKLTTQKKNKTEWKNEEKSK